MNHTIGTMAVLVSFANNIFIIYSVSSYYHPCSINTQFYSIYSVITLEVN